MLIGLKENFKLNRENILEILNKIPAKKKRQNDRIKRRVRENHRAFRLHKFVQEFINETVEKEKDILSKVFLFVVL